MEILNVICDYLSNTNTDYSLLISGEWGSGKTYFLKNEIFNKVRELKVQNINDGKPEIKNLDPVYISLFGISDISEIDKRIFLELNPRLKTKPGYVLNFIANKLSGYINLKLFENEDYKQYLSIFSIPNYKVLFFDDFERIEESILNEALGYLNSFVEHQKIKVIIIGDEEILRGKVKDYDKVKEKLIRFTYCFTPDIKRIFNDFVKVYDGDFKKYILSNKEFICEIFRKGKHSNLRTLRFSLDLLENIFATVEQSQIEKQYKAELLDRFTLFLLTYSIEYKKNNDKNKLIELKQLSSQNVLNFSRLDLKALLGNNEKITVDPVEKTYVDIFKETYLPFGNHFYEYSEIITDYVHYGFLDIKGLKENIIKIAEELRRKEITEEQVIISKLSNIFMLNDQELEPLIAGVIKKVNAGEFDLVSYPNIFATLIQIELYNIYDFKVTEDIIRIFIEGIDKSKRRATYIEAFRYKIPMWREQNAKYEIIADYTIKANDSLLDDELKIYANKIPQLIEENLEVELQAHIVNEKYLFQPIFSFLDPSIIFDSLTRAQNRTVYYFRDGLFGRHPSYEATSTTKKENAFFVAFLDILNHHISKLEKTTINKVAFIELQKAVNKIVTIRD